MARIKYNPLLYPVQGKHFGYTFIRNHYGFSMMPGQRNKRTRWNRQAQRMQNIQKAIRNWRNMDAATQANWDTFAASHPVPSKRSASVFLTGYQLFLKRNHYCFLNHGIESDFMMAPVLTALPAGGPVFYLQAGINQVDLTELYISNFGTIPAAGQWVQFMAIPYSETSGQFFPAIHSTLEILASYLDGFFLSLEMPVNVAGIVYSVYLSKPLNRGYEYPGSKTRYMGCFTTKSFLGLSDTPNSYAGQAGKTPIVNVAENALEWGSGGGGGLTCADLPDCPTIIDILSTQQIMIAAIVNLTGASLPAVKNGILYNRNAATNLNLSSAAAWVLPTRVQIINLQTYLGGAAVAGQPLKEADLLYWLSIAGNTNANLFNGRGSGRRDGTPAAYTNIQSRGYFWTSTPYFGAGLYYYFLRSGFNSLDLGGVNLYNIGYSVRLCKLATGVADGVQGVYIGNNGRAYRTITINQVEWMADNLAETEMRDGSVFPERPIAADWENILTQAYCFYNNDYANV